MKILAILFVLASVAFAGEFQKEILLIVDGDDFSRVTLMLESGWTVKTCAASVASNFASDLRYGHARFVFVMEAPPPEVLAKIQEEKRAEFQKRREEYLANKAKENQPEKR